MVRQFNLPNEDEEFHSEEVVAFDRKAVRDKSQLDPIALQRLDLAGAFSRYQKNNPKLGFSKLLAAWVERRREAGLPVDLVDPEATEPSPDFRAFLRLQFNQARKTS